MMKIIQPAQKLYFLKNLFAWAIYHPRAKYSLKGLLYSYRINFGTDSTDPCGDSNGSLF